MNAHLFILVGELIFRVRSSPLPGNTSPGSRIIKQIKILLVLLPNNPSKHRLNSVSYINILNSVR